MHKARMIVAVLALAFAGCEEASKLPEKPQILPDKTALTFGGAVGEGVWVGTQVVETLQLKNGGQNELVVTAVRLEGEDQALFEHMIDKTKIPSEKRAFVQVTYKPTAAGKSSAVLVVESNAENTPVLEVPISATAIAPQE